MHPHSFPVENSAATRAGLMTYLASKLAPLFSGGELRSQLQDFLAPLSTAEITRCLRNEAEETCGRLADALVRNSAARDPVTAAVDVVAMEFPHFSAADRNRIAEFTRAVREMAIENDGTILDRDFINAGFSPAEAGRLLPLAMRVQAVLDGRAKPAQDGLTGGAASRLIEAGVRAGLRFNPNALSLAPHHAAA